MKVAELIAYLSNYPQGAEVGHIVTTALGDGDEDSDLVTFDTVHFEESRMLGGPMVVLR